MWANQLLQFTSITMAFCNIWILLEDKSNILFTIIVLIIGVIIGIIYVHKDLQVRKLKYNVWMLQQNHLLAERTIEILKKEKEYLQTTLSACQRSIGESSMTKNVSEVFSNVEQLRYRNLNSSAFPDCSCTESTSNTRQASNENLDSADARKCLAPEATPHNRQVRDGNSDSANDTKCLDSEAISDTRQARDDNSDSIDASECLVSRATSDNQQAKDGNSESAIVPKYLDSEATSDTRLARDGNLDSADVANCLNSEALSENRQPKDGNSNYTNASECLESEATLDNLLHMYDASKYSDIRRTLMNAEKTTEILVKPNTSSVPETSRKTTTSCDSSSETQNQNHKFKPELDKCSSVEDINTCAFGISNESTRSCECSCCSQSRSEVTKGQSVLCHSNLEISQTKNSSTTNLPVMSEQQNKTNREADTINKKPKKSRSTHGNTSHNLKDLVQTMCSEFLDDLERQIGRDHPDFASMLENLAKLHSDAGRFAEAEKFLTESLTIREKASGKNTREFLAALNTLGTMYYAQKRYEESAPLFKLGLEIRENILGSDHIDIAKPLRQYALLCQKLNKMEESQQYLRKALRVYQSALGPNCKSAVKIRSDLIACLKKMKNTESAKQQ